MNLLTLKIEIKDQNVFVLINENKKNKAELLFFEDLLLRPMSLLILIKFL
jgi:hypothetical protein